MVRAAVEMNAGSESETISGHRDSPVLMSILLEGRLALLQGLAPIYAKKELESMTEN